MDTLYVVIALAGGFWAGLRWSRTGQRLDDITAAAAAAAAVNDAVDDAELHDSYTTYTSGRWGTGVGDLPA